MGFYIILVREPESSISIIGVGVLVGLLGSVLIFLLALIMGLKMRKIRVRKKNEETVDEGAESNLLKLEKKESFVMETSLALNSGFDNVIQVDPDVLPKRSSKLFLFT